MIDMSILQPIVALAAWTMVMWFWMYATRLPAMNARPLPPEELATLNQGKLDSLLPPKVQWKAYNYNHLHEAPTVFYAITLVLAFTDSGDGLAAILAWAYVALRMAHSIVQATINRVMWRFAIFSASSFVLMALIVLAALAVF